MVFACVFVFMAASSQATPFAGQIWTGAGYGFSPHDLTSTFFSGLGPSLAQFTVDEIDFNSQALIGSYGGSVTYTQFLSNNLAGAPGPNGLVWADLASALFGANTLLTNGTTTSFFQFTGTAFFPANFSITRDDGFVLYVNGGLVIDASAPVAPTITPVNLGLPSGVYSFTLNYAAWNSFPEVLQAPDIRPIPEPTTMLLLGLGMLGIAGIRRKFRS